MNIVGKIGNFIIAYQSQIQIGVLVLAALIAVILLIKAAVNAGKKRKLLTQIHDTVAEINTAVTSLSEKKSDVIYIDNRVLEKEGSPAASVQQSVREVFEEVSQTQVQAQESVAAPEASAHEIQEESPAEPAADIPKKYFSRDCNVSKTGKTYTLEELEQQIKE